jgi:hypothetical protein
MFPIMAAMQVAGMGMQVMGAMKKSSAMKKASAASQKAEALRFKQMEMDAARKQRQIIRQSYLAQSEALVRGTGQTGSSALGGSSALPGSYGQIRSDERENFSYVAAQLGIGRGIFEAKAAEAKANQEAAEGSAFSSLGGAIAGSADPASKAMTSLFFGQTPQGSPSSGLGSTAGSGFEFEFGYM